MIALLLHNVQNIHNVQNYFNYLTSHVSHILCFRDSLSLFISVDPFFVCACNSFEQELGSTSGSMDEWVSVEEVKEMGSTAIGGPVVIWNPRDASVPGFIAIWEPADFFLRQWLLPSFSSFSRVQGVHILDLFFFQQMKLSNFEKQVFISINV